MSDTQVVLSKIAALRQRLEQTRRLSDHGSNSAEPDLKNPFHTLESYVKAGARHNLLLEGAVRELGSGNADAATMPTQLTARARRLLEHGRELVASLRALANDPLLNQEDTGPFALWYREAAAMADAALRLFQAFPESPGDQLRLCEGLEGILAVVSERLAALSAALDGQRRDSGRTDALTDLFQDVAAGKIPDIKRFVDLAETLLDEARDGAPLRFHYADADQPARFVACHSLTAAQVMARLVRHDPELSTRPMQPLLAAMLHDMGMVGVPAEILNHSQALTDAQRRVVEGHTRTGAELAAKLSPKSAWLAEVALNHHERLDGSGYPNGFREGHLVPLVRLVTVCDVYAAQCCPRPHRPAREPRTALTDTLLMAEKGLLDRDYAEWLLLLSFYPVGSVVELADGAIGLVIATHQSRNLLAQPARPVLALLADSQGQPLPGPRHLDLAQCDGRSIVRSLGSSERRRLLGKRFPELA